jgi:hypothetical protein
MFQELVISPFWYVAERLRWAEPMHRSGSGNTRDFRAEKNNGREGKKRGNVNWFSKQMHEKEDWRWRR